jgi:hypothetical protein
MSAPMLDETVIAKNMLLTNFEGDLLKSNKAKRARDNIGISAMWPSSI